jgi:hypothetical protein
MQSNPPESYHMKTQNTEQTAAHTLHLPIAIYSPSNDPEHVRIIDGKHFTLFDSQNADVWPMSPEIRAFIIEAVNSHAANLATIKALREALEAVTNKLAMWPEGSNPEFFPCMKQARSALSP